MKQKNGNSRLSASPKDTAGPAQRTDRKKRYLELVALSGALQRLHDATSLQNLLDCFKDAVLFWDEKTRYPKDADHEEVFNVFCALLYVHFSFVHDQITARDELLEMRLKEFRLTPRERDVLYWLCEGKDNESIAKILKVSVVRVKKCITAILEKLAVETRASAIVRVQELRQSRRLVEVARHFRRRMQPRERRLPSLPLFLHGCPCINCQVERGALLRRG